MDLFIKSTIVINSAIFLLFLFLISLIIFMYHQNRKKLEELTFVDPVTNGMNRIHFEMGALQLLQNVPTKSYALVSLDIQKFKLINDTFGSEAGNQTLKYIHDILQAHLQDGELSARITADNFNILIRTMPQKQIVARTENIMKEINSYNDHLAQKYFLTASVGIYIVDEPNLNFIAIQDRATVARKNVTHTYADHFSYCQFYSNLERMRLIREK